MQQKQLQAQKKGQVGTLATTILSLGIASIVLVLLLVINQELIDTDTLSKSNIGARVVNQSLISVTSIGRALSASTNTACAASIVTVINGSSTASATQVIPITNYSTTGCTIYSTGGLFNNTNWTVTYDFTYGDQAFIGANKTIQGLGSFGDFWTIIVLAVVAAVVLGIIFGLFGRQQGR